MTVTARNLNRAAGLAAVAAGLLFIGVQINHPHLDVTSITTTEMAIRDSLKILMAVLALVGITGMYLRQVKQYVLPSIAGTSSGYVNDVLAAATNRSAIGNIGLLNTAIHVQGITYLAGGLLFGIALYRAAVLARWAAALLAVGGIVTAVLSVMPDAFYRLLALPNGIAMMALGFSLWREQRPQGVVPVTSGAVLDSVGAR